MFDLTHRSCFGKYANDVKAERRRKFKTRQYQYFFSQAPIFIQTLALSRLNTLELLQIFQLLDIAHHLRKTGDTVVIREGDDVEAACLGSLQNIKIADAGFLKIRRSGRMQMQIDPAAAADAAQADTIAQWLPQVPVPASSSENPAKIRVVSTGLDYRIELSGIAAEHVQCIVAPGEGLKVASNKVDGRTVDVSLKATEGAKPSSQPSEAVVAWTDQGKPRGVSVPLNRP